MFLGYKSFKTALYWQAIKDYQWRILRLSILLTILSILIVSTIPSTYLGTAKLEFLSRQTALASEAHLPLTETLKHNELASIYEEMLLENITKGLLTKLTKLKLSDVDSELEKALTEYVVITRIKQKIRTALPFMPQQDPDFLAPKQLLMLKNNYTKEQLIQNLHLRYSSRQREVYIDYKDRNATFAIIIAKLAADLYVQSVAESKTQLTEQFEQQVKLNTMQPPTLANTVDSNIHIGNYTTIRLKPNRILIVSMSFLVSLLVISSLVLLLVRLQAADGYKNQLLTAKSSKSNT